MVNVHVKSGMDMDGSCGFLENQLSSAPALAAPRCFVHRWGATPADPGLMGIVGDQLRGPALELFDPKISWCFLSGVSTGMKSGVQLVLNGDLT